VSLYRPHVLVIDDEPQIHRFLAPALAAAGYDASRADTAGAGMKAIAQRAPDAVILDLGLPDMDGKTALREIREFFKGPVLILSARDRESEKIEALDLGADDYVEKPFGVGELLARLRVALRRGPAGEAQAGNVRAGELEIDIAAHTVRRAGARVRLSPKEFELLGRMVEAGGKVVTHRQLLTAVWGPAHVHDTQYLRVFIGQLRQKLETDPATPRHIVTETGVGYRFLAE
jgi:two-component system KDP operon response regulator KdpE